MGGSCRSTHLFIHNELSVSSFHVLFLKLELLTQPLVSNEKKSL